MIKVYAFPSLVEEEIIVLLVLNNVFLYLITSYILLLILVLMLHLDFALFIVYTPKSLWVNKSIIKRGKDINCILSMQIR